MSSVQYRILFYDGREVHSNVDLPEADTKWTPTPSDNAKKRYEMVRQIVLSVIGEDNDLEHVNVWHEGRYLDMFVDETGVLKDLPFNNKATAIYRANVLAHDPDHEPEDALPVIAGNAVLFMEKVWG